MLSDAEATERFTPTEKEQVFAILSNQCPHNKGWKYDGHSHNDDAYSCKLCGEIEWY